MRVSILAPSLVRSDTRPRMRRGFWVWHLWLPLAACAAMLVLSSTTSLDTELAARWFFDPRQRDWISASSWWANELLHEGGRNLVRLAVLAALGIWAAGVHLARWHRRRVVAAYIALSVILTVALAGLLKTLTNVDCPWDLAQFNGTRPYVHVFGDRPDELPRSRCFPGAHSASGFAFLCLYFAFRDRHRRLARWGLAFGTALGALYALGQEARGAHFLSHDLSSAFLAWFVALSLYVPMRERLRQRDVPASRSERRTGYRMPRLTTARIDGSGGGFRHGRCPDRTQRN